MRNGKKFEKNLPCGENETFHIPPVQKGRVKNMKNKLNDLNNHLFEQLERLNDDELSGEKLSEEYTRTKAMTNVAAQILSNASLILEAKKAFGNGDIEKIPLLLGGGDDDKQ